MQDTPIPIITYVQDDNTRIRIGHGDFVSDLRPEQNSSYPKQIQFCGFLNIKLDHRRQLGPDRPTGLAGLCHC